MMAWKPKSLNLFQIVATLLTFGILIMAFFSVWQQVMIINLGYEISSLKKQEEKLVNQNRMNRLNLAKFLKNKNLESIGKNKFQLREAKEGQFVFLDKESLE